VSYVEVDAKSDVFIDFIRIKNPIKLDITFEKTNKIR